MKHSLIVVAFATVFFASSSFADQNAVDNSGKNKRDVRADSSTLTPPDQSRGSKEDVELTRKIRKAVTSDKSLSTKAHNVKIITLNGVATLRGPVDTAAEKTKIGSIASSVVGGDGNVTNQLEIKN